MTNSGNVLDFKCKDLKLVKILPGNNPIPVKLYKVAAGKPHVIFDDLEPVTLDLRKYLIKNEGYTNLFQVMSESLEPEIRKGDKLVIDQTLANNFPQQIHGKIITCILDGENIVKRYKCDGENGTLLSFNPFYPPIKIQNFQYFKIHGVCTYLIREANDFTFNNSEREKDLGLKRINDILNNTELADEKKVKQIEKIMVKFIPSK